MENIKDMSKSQDDHNLKLNIPCDDKKMHPSENAESCMTMSSVGRMEPCFFKWLNEERLDLCNVLERVQSRFRPELAGQKSQHM